MVTFPDLHDPRRADSHEMTRKDAEKAILLEMDWLQKCKQAFVDWDSDEENEEEGRAEWSILEGRKRYKTFFLGEITRFLKWVIYFGKNELFRLKKTF